MTAPIVRELREGQGGSQMPSPERAWKGLAWFGSVLALIGFAEAAVYLYPWGFGSREWEFGAAAQLLGALPLPTIGLALVLAAAVARGSRRGRFWMAALLAVVGLAVWVVLGLFVLVVPLALRSTPPAGAVAIRQTIARTMIAGAGFGALYLTTALLTVIGATRSHSRR